MRSSLKRPILGTGELLWDLLPSGARLGGATTNFCILSSRLGDFVSLITSLGRDDLGTEALEKLQTVAASVDSAGHFDLSGIQISDDLPTGTVSVVLDAVGRPQYSIVDPVAWDQVRMQPELKHRAETASAICFGTLAQRHKVSRDSIRAMVEATSPDCVRICDVNLRMPHCTPETLRWSIDHATILKISDEELAGVAEMLGLRKRIPVRPTAKDDETLTAWACDATHALLYFVPQCRLIAITLGPHGSLISDRSASHRHMGFPIEVVDTIGAGDAFTAGLVHAYTRQSTLAQINTVSNLCGSYVASQPGATPEIPASLLDKIAIALSH